MECAVVILNYNGITYLREFLPVLTKNTLQSRIIIADNCSTDGSVSFIEQEYADLKLIKLTKNYGFAGGYNHTLTQLQEKYYILLNSDIEVTYGWDVPLLDMLKNNVEIAACQPKIRSYHNRDYFEYAGAAGGFIDILGYPFCRGRIFDVIEKDYGQYEDTREIFWATGACLAVKSEVYHDLNGFDATFFAHMEEIDLCWRILNKGFKIYYTPNSTVYHVGGATLSKQSPTKTYLNFRNNLALLYKNNTLYNFILIITIRIFLDLLGGLNFGFKSGMGHFISVIRAYFDFNRMLGKLDRNLYNKKSRTIVYRHFILWKYYAERKKVFSKLKF